ncbi:MAG TPA: SgcJ/EcaC family oxidoreductase [Brevundimonas sp.]|jgi:uncharacterized protein (TIGR02246 family)|nr:SgcJ/EcaC family oxidoreductase [Brevundimonas sp.]
MLDCAPEAVVERQIAAYRARDAAAFAALYAPDAVLYEHPGVVMMRGRDEIASKYAVTFARNPDLRLTIETRIVNGDYVVDKEVLQSRQVTGYATAIYHVSNCLIDRVDFLPLVETAQ